MPAAALELSGVAGDLAGALVLFAFVLSVSLLCASLLMWGYHSSPAVRLGWKKAVCEVIVNLSILLSWTFACPCCALGPVGEGVMRKNVITPTHPLQPGTAHRK